MNNHHHHHQPQPPSPNQLPYLKTRKTNQSMLPKPILRFPNQFSSRLFNQFSQFPSQSKHTTVKLTNPLPNPIPTIYTTDNPLLFISPNRYP
ncbi:hypothetical protein Hanom_Chr04g00376861 [Helianthus anomalus]